MFFLSILRCLNWYCGVSVWWFWVYTYEMAHAQCLFVSLSFSQWELFFFMLYYSIIQHHWSQAYMPICQWLGANHQVYTVCGFHDMGQSSGVRATSVAVSKVTTVIVSFMLVAVCSACSFNYWKFIVKFYYGKWPWCCISKNTQCFIKICWMRTLQNVKQVHVPCIVVPWWATPCWTFRFQSGYIVMWSCVRLVSSMGIQVENSPCLR